MCARLTCKDIRRQLDVGAPQIPALRMCTSSPYTCVHHLTPVYIFTLHLCTSPHTCVHHLTPVYTSTLHPCSNQGPLRAEPWPDSSLFSLLALCPNKRPYSHSIEESYIFLAASYATNKTKRSPLCTLVVQYMYRSWQVER